MVKFPLTIFAIVCLAVTGQAQSALLREDFESSATAFEFTGQWHVEDDTSPCAALLTPFPSSTHCAWFGSSSACGYGTGPRDGVLRLVNPVQLPANTPNVVLRYRRFLDTEGCADGFDVSSVVITDAADVPIVTGSDCALESGWIDRRLDLSAQAGQQIGLSFRFSTGDNKYNDTLGWWIDDIEIVSEPGSITCTASSACPCANQSNASGSYPTSLPNEDSGGCKHSALTEGKLFGNGVPSVAADSVQLVVRDLPPVSLALYIQGWAVQASAFGDGRLCVGGSLVRLASRGVTNGQDVYPPAGQVSLAAQCAVSAQGGTQVFQVLYRDAASYCTSSTFNATNAYVIAWRP